MGLSDIPAPFPSIFRRRAERDEDEAGRGRPAIKETFVSNDQTNKIIASVAMSIGLMLAAGLVTFLFYWTFQKESSLFIGVLAALMFAYAVNMTVYIAVIRSKLSVHAFRYYIGVSIIAALINLGVAIVFFMRAYRRMAKSAYLPSASRDYAESPMPPAYDPIDADPMPVTRSSDLPPQM